MVILTPSRKLIYICIYDPPLFVIAPLPHGMVSIRGSTKPRKIKQNHKKRKTNRGRKGELRKRKEKKGKTKGKAMEK